MKSADPVSGRELDLMLNGNKPMAAFYRVLGEFYDEKSGQDFSHYVKSGKFNEKKFTINNKGQNYTLLYTAYCTIGQEWRLSLYKTLKKLGQEVWNEEMEYLEGWLLGYV